MKKEIKVSVIIPIYNHYVKYVRQCLESLKNQSLQDLEIILIDNGATEEAKKLIEEYLNIDTRFKVIHFQTNQGYGSAMNEGLKIAQGKYIGFIESDDWIEKDMYSSLFAIAEQTNVDIVESQIFFYYGHENNKNLYSSKYPEQYFNKVISNIHDIKEYAIGIASHWSKIYKREMLNKFDINFNSNEISCPDGGFIYKTFVNAKTIYITPKAYIHYRRDNNNSSIHSGDIMAKRVYSEHKYISQYLEKIDASQNIWDIHLANMVRSVIYNYYNRCTYSKLEFIKQASIEFNKYLTNGKLSFTYLNKEEKRLCQLILKRPSIFYIFSLINDRKYDHRYNIYKYIFGLYTKIYTSEKTSYYLLGLKYFEKNAQNGAKKPIAYKEDTDTHNIYCIFGLRIKIKKNRLELIETKLEKFEKVNLYAINRNLSNEIADLKRQNVEFRKKLGLKQNIKIFCTYHYLDGYPIFKSDIYEPIQTGVSVMDFDYGILKDNTGDNISDKNDFYAELTASYWIWKNYIKENPNVEYIGTAHHYDHMNFSDIEICERQGFSQKSTIEYEEQFNKECNAENVYFSDFDIIMPKKEYYDKYGKFEKNMTLYEQYCLHHPAEQYHIFEDIIREFHPEQAIYLTRLRNMKNFYLGNTYIMKKELFVEYMEWIFPMLFELEKRTNMWEAYIDFVPKKKRIPPFLSERFINLWLEYKKLEQPLRILEKTWNNTRKNIPVKTTWGH